MVRNTVLDLTLTDLLSRLHHSNTLQTLTLMSHLLSRTETIRESKDVDLERVAAVQTTSELAVQRTVAFEFGAPCAGVVTNEIKVGAIVRVQYRICPR